MAKRVSLLQDGQTFQSIIKSQAGSGLAASATAKVTKVTMVSSTQAKVTYSILIGGQSALAHQAGVAVFQDGTWKVGLASFCGLLALENGGKTSGLPAACKSAAYQMVRSVGAPAERAPAPLPRKPRRSPWPCSPWCCS